MVVAFHCSQQSSRVTASHDIEKTIELSHAVVVARVLQRCQAAPLPDLKGKARVVFRKRQARSSMSQILQTVKTGMGSRTETRYTQCAHRGTKKHRDRE